MSRNVAALAIRVALLACLFTTLSLAESWSGTLVDARCFANQQRNVNPTDTQTFVDIDRNYEIRYCAPKAKTKEFAIVQQDGLVLTFDAKGNAKAAQLVRNLRKNAAVWVEVIGEKRKNTIEVLSLSSPEE